jgi:cytochrome c2
MKKLALLILVLAACKGEQPIGDVDHGKQLVTQYGCATCHDIPGIEGAHGMVGPPLAKLASRKTIAGKLPNTPDTVIKWLQDPQAVNPGSSMPNMGVTPADARDIAAFLNTLK